jgi:hypothetical protein
MHRYKCVIRVDHSLLEIYIYSVILQVYYIVEEYPFLLIQIQIFFNTVLLMLL